MFAFLAGAAMSLESSGPPALPREFRGAWVATVDNIDWPSKPGLDISVQKEELRHLLKLLSQLRFNAVLFQVRPNCDALYHSNLEPSSWYVTGEQGRSLSWDPLEFAVKTGHSLGLEVHAWFNPFRAKHPAQKGDCCDSHVSKLHPDWMKAYGRYGWLDPGLSAVREHSQQVILDVVNRYDIDGVHIDDYFYPYPEGGNPFPDDTSYSAYQTSGGTLSRLAWRRSNVDTFVRDLNSGIHKAKPWVKFGISPFGIYRPNVPEGIKAGVDQYDDLAADVLKWWKEGTCDYLSPQLYWKTTSEFQPFRKLLQWWSDNNILKRNLWPGIYTSQLSNKKAHWSVAEVEKQIRLTRALASGTVHFSARAFNSDAQGVASSLESGLYQLRAVVPSSPWLGNGKVNAVQSMSVRSLTVSWGHDDTIRFYAVWSDVSGRWALNQLSDKCDYSSPRPCRVAVVAVSRSGIASTPVMARLVAKGS